MYVLFLERDKSLLLILQGHNNTYDTQMTLDDFYCKLQSDISLRMIVTLCRLSLLEGKELRLTQAESIFSKPFIQNPFWGTPSITRTKVEEFYLSGQISRAQLVPGAREGVEALRALGFRLIIVTARVKDMHTDSWAWVERWFPGCFDSLICTGQFANTGKLAQDDGGADASTHKEYTIATGLSKAEVCIDIGAKLLIDDSLENALACADYIPLDGVTRPPPVLLFGSYEWNKRLSFSSHEHDDMVYEGRFQREGGKFLDEDAKRGDEALEQANSKHSICRVKDWSEVVRYVTKMKDELLKK